MKKKKIVKKRKKKKVKSKRKPTKKAKKVEKEVIADSVEKEKEKVVDDVEKDTIKADSEEKGKEKVDDTTDPNWTPASCLLINASSFTTPKNFEDRFVEISDHLLNTVALVINGKRYRFTELEYYFTSSTHNDPFTHCDDVQYTLANWYFHRSGKSYKNGSYKGLDISIGNSEKEAGGILIRSIESLDGTASVVCGPSKTVDKILELCKAEQNVKGFVEEHLKKNLSVAKTPGKPLYIEFDASLPRREVFRSARVGLHMTKTNVDAKLQQQYVYKLYRFLTNPKSIPKGRNLTILGLLHKGVSRTDIMRISGATAGLTDKTISLFEKGKKGSVDKFMGSRLADDEVSEAFGCLHHLL